MKKQLNIILILSGAMLLLSSVMQGQRLQVDGSSGVFDVTPIFGTFNNTTLLGQFIGKNGVDPQLRFDSDTTGFIDIGLDGSGNFVIENSDVQSFFLTQSGKVGIGDATPEELLEVNGNVKANKFLGDGSMLTNIDLSLSIDTLRLTNDTTTVNLSAFLNNWTINDGRDAAFGYNNVATGDSSTAVGYNNIADTTFSTAVGYQNQATGFGSSAFGYINDATGDLSSAFGYFSFATGFRSSAFGYRNDATGFRSSAFGYFNFVTGDDSSAFGSFNEVTGDLSSAFGSRNDATGLESSAFGSRNFATGDDSSAFGSRNDATGFRSSAFGYFNDATGDDSSAFGSFNDATGDVSSAFGCDNDATGFVSSAFGYRNDATGSQSSAFGYNTLANVYGLMAIGRYNAIPVGNNTVWVDTDPVFVIGNGEDSANLSTALTILKNGKVGIGTDSPSQELDVNGKARIRDLPSGSGITVVADANGNLFKSSSSPNVNEQRINNQQGEIEILQEENKIKDQKIEELEARLAKIEALLSGKVETNNTTSNLTSATLQQNAPNPFNEATTIQYFIPEGTKNASLQVVDQNGRIIKTIPIQATGKGQITLQANLLSAGTYSYSLVLDGQMMKTKQMVLTH